MPLKRKVPNHIPPVERPCAICNQPVNLKAAKSNEDGQIVHEECYVEKISLKKGVRSENCHAAYWRY
jgi:hypothetical protein